MPEARISPGKLFGKLLEVTTALAQLKYHPTLKRPSLAAFFLFSFKTCLCPVQPLPPYILNSTVPTFPLSKRQISPSSRLFTHDLSTPSHSTLILFCLSCKIAKMPVKWDEKATSDLFLSMLTVVAPGELTVEQKAKVEALMREKGYPVNWNGIR